MGLPASGLENEELTANANDFVDKVVAAGEDESFWDLSMITHIAPFEDRLKGAT